MRRGIGAWLGALVLASAPACGDEASVRRVPYVSGERLRADLVGLAGAEILIGWWDTELSAHCSFAYDEQGDLRCLPGLHRTAGRFHRDRALNVNGAVPDVGLRYLDQDCTVPVHVSPAGVPVAAYAAGAEEVVPCSAPPEVRYRIHRVGAARAASALYRQLGGECREATVQAGEAVYELGPVVEPSVFVAATTVRTPWPSGLEVVVVEADDGARQAVFAVDGQRDAVCWGASYYGKDDGSCVPMLGRVAFLAGEFADETCETPVGYDRADPICGPPLVVFERADEPVPHETGDAVDEAAVYRGSSQTGCTPAPPDGKRYFRPGAPIPTSSFPTLTSVYTGDGVVTAQVVTDDGGTPIRSVGLLHAGERCSPLTTCEGTIRCVPDLRLPPRSWFADGECTEPLAPLCDAPEGALIATPRDPALCDDAAPYGPIVTAGPQHEGAVYELDGDGTCSLVDTQFCFRTLGAGADLSALPILERRTEPSDG